MTSYRTLYYEKEQEAAALKAELDRVREVVDLAGIARHMKVERFTPQQWKQRDLLPPVDFPDIKGEPLWYASTIREQFAWPTGRAWYDDVEKAAPDEGRTASAA